jgi:hypothetical protein
MEPLQTPLPPPPLELSQAPIATPPAELSQALTPPPANLIPDFGFSSFLEQADPIIQRIFPPRNIKKHFELKCWQFFLAVL